MYSIIHYPHHIIATTTNMIISVVIIIVVSGQALCAACPRGGTGQDQPGGGLIMECLVAYSTNRENVGLALLLVV